MSNITDKQEQFSQLLNQNLSPSAAIKSPQYLKGRDAQVESVKRALSMSGRQVFIHGFRGVGKTSLAQTTATMLQSSEAEPIAVTCGSNSSLYSVILDIANRAMPSDPRTYKSVVEKSLSVTKAPLTLSQKKSIEQGIISEPKTINEAISLFQFSTSMHSNSPVVIIDEFDQIKDVLVHSDFSLFFKDLSSQDCDTHIICCGVGESLDDLFKSHNSTYRYFETINLGRLKLDALREIVLNAAKALDITIDDTTSWRLARTSDGFPYFVHLQCEKIFWAVFDRCEGDWQGASVEISDYKTGIKDAVQSIQDELRRPYELATRKYKNDCEPILWAAAHNHEFERKLADIYKSYMNITKENSLSILNENQFGTRMYNLCKPEWGAMFVSNGKGWYQYNEKVMRGFARLRAEELGVELRPDHPKE